MTTVSSLKLLDCEAFYHYLYMTALMKDVAAYIHNANSVINTPEVRARICFNLFPNTNVLLDKKGLFQAKMLSNLLRFVSF